MHFGLWDRISTILGSSVWDKVFPYLSEIEVSAHDMYEKDSSHIYSLSHKT